MREWKGVLEAFTLAEVVKLWKSEVVSCFGCCRTLCTRVLGSRPVFMPELSYYMSGDEDHPSQ